MKSPTVNLALVFLFLFNVSKVQAQVKKGELIRGKGIASTISPTEKHQYIVKLDNNQFAFFRLIQQGVDLKITTYSPKGEKLEDFDSPNGKDGPELFSITSAKKGDYMIEVSPFDGKEPNGNYSLKVNTIRPKAISQNDQVDELFAPWDNQDTPGSSIAVLKDGAVVYKKGYGMANLEYDIANSPSTVFHIASISKQFTVFSILLLEKEGKLSLEDDIRKYIPEVPDFGKTITLRHLASHTSGLRDQWNLLAMAGWRLDDVITKEHVLKLVSKQKELNFNPGDEYFYCNTGFTLLAEVVARVADQSFAEFTQENIFEPLQMGHTLFYDDHEKIVKNRAYSYYADNNGYKKSVLSYANVGATSLFTTVEDLSLWSTNFSTLKVGNKGMVDKMNTLAVLNNGEEFGGALGQFVGNYKGLDEIQHGGADAGYRSYLTRFPDENFSVIVFSNVAEFNPTGIAHDVVDIYLKDRIKTAPKQKVGENNDAPEELVLDQNRLETYVGEFELQAGFVITITREESRLFAKATGQSTLPLTLLSTTEFKVEGIEAKIEFVPNGEEKVKLFRLQQAGQVTDAPRAEKFDVAGVKVSDFSGSFYSEELSITYDFVVVDGQLTARHSRLSDFGLDPVKKDVFSGAVWFFGQVEFIRDSNNVITGCKVSNGRVRNLYFSKVD